MICPGFVEVELAKSQFPPQPKQTKKRSSTENVKLPDSTKYLHRNPATPPPTSHETRLAELVSIAIRKRSTPGRPHI